MEMRQANIDDVDKINEIFSEGILQELKFQYSSNAKIKKEFEWEVKNHKKYINKDLKDKNQYWIVLELNGLVIGFGSSYIKDGKGVVESVYVDKGFRRKGYGIKIVKELLRWIRSKKVRVIESNLFVKNLPSLKLHEKLGFKSYMFRMRLE